MVKLVVLALSLLVLGCGVLSHPTAIIANVKRGGCKDKMNNCGMLLQSGQYSCNMMLMKRFCKLSCAACNECIDEMDECNQYVSFCNAQGNVGEMCKKTCGRCSGAGGNPNPPPAPKPACTDKAGTANCKPYLSYCNSPGNVAELCKKSCGLCGGAGGKPNPPPQPQPKPTPQPQPTSPPSGSDKAVLIQGTEQACADAHNEYRRKHHVPDIVVDNTVLRTSEAYAKKMADEGTWGHDYSTSYGENLWESRSSYATDDPVQLCKQAVKAWYDEIKDYDFNQPGFSMATGHFTQVVWKNSQKLGMAIAKIYRNGMYRYVGVARYNPAGNSGDYSGNVLPQ